jgi:hypothetical protein
MALHGTDVGTLQVDLSPTTGDDPHQALHQRGLAHAVAAHDGDDLVLADGEIQIPEDFALPVGHVVARYIQH